MNRPKYKIAVVGMSCRFPEGSTLASFHDLLAGGQNAFTDLPKNRPFLDNRSLIRCNIGAFIQDPYHFDNDYFQISEREALAMDPQQRLALELTEEALKTTGWTNMQESTFGIFLGANQRAYADIYSQAILLNAINADQNLGNSDLQEIFTDKVVTGNITNMIAARIAHHFNFKGPALTIDTACSSALVAVHLACQSIYTGEVEVAIAGGINLNLSPTIFKTMEVAGVLSPRNICEPFSKESDGILLGEGGGIVLLKDYHKAIEDGDSIWCTIEASGQNNDGRTLGLMAPSWKSQLSLLESIYTRNNIDREKITYVEAHGTSTRIGDSVEITVLKKFFETTSQKISVGSVKSNIGHLLGASGIAGLIKTILSLHHGLIYPSVLKCEVNPKWDLNKSNLYIPRASTPWQEEIKWAAINSFGFGGTNAHVVLKKDPAEILDFSTHHEPPLFKKKAFNYPVIYPSREIVKIDKARSNANTYELLYIPTSYEKIRVSENLVEKWISISIDSSTSLLFHKEGMIKAHNSIQFTRISAHECSFDFCNLIHVDWFFETLSKELDYGLILDFTKLQDEELRMLKACKYFLELLRQNITATVYLIIGQNAIHNAMKTLFNVFFEEYPNAQGGIIEINGKVKSLPYDVLDYTYSQAFKLMSGNPYVSSLKLRTLAENRISLGPKKSILVIGGSSGIGQKIAFHLHTTQNVPIIFTGTRLEANLSPDIKKRLKPTFRYVQYFCKDKLQLKAIGINEEEGLEGVVFAAGKIGYASLTSMSMEDFEQVLSVKIQGINNLRQALEIVDYNFVHVLSSLSSLSPQWGKGLSAYAAANAYLNRFSEFDQRWQTLIYSMWEGTGMSENLSGYHSLQALDNNDLLESYLSHTNCKSSSLIIANAIDVVDARFTWSTLKSSTFVTPKKTAHTGLDLESFITELIADYTNIPVIEINRETPFTDLGLDSLSAVDIVSEVEKEFHLTLDPTLLYEYDSISKLITYLDLEEVESYPLLPTQNTFYSSALLYPEKACNCLVKLSIRKTYDKDRLRKTIDLWVRRHESLRMNFRINEKGCRQFINDQVIATDPFDKNSSYKIDAPIPISNERLFSLHIEEEAAITTFIFCAHHIITDAWSMGLLLKDLMDLYENDKAKPPPPLIPFLRQYNFEDTVPSDVKSYWNNQLNGLTSITLKDDNDSYLSEEVGQCGIRLNTVRTARIASIAKSIGVSIFELILTIYFETLDQAFDLEQYAIRVATENRDRCYKRMKELTGCFADSLPIKKPSGGFENISSYALQVRQQIKKARQNGKISSQQLANLGRSVSTDHPQNFSPFGISFLPLNRLLSDNGEDIWLSSSSSLSFTAVSLIIIQHQSRFNFQWQFTPSKISKENADRITGLFYENLMEMTNGDSAIQTLHSTFADASKRYSNKIAIQENYGNISYGALQQRIRKVKALLLNKTASSENLIGVLAFPGIHAVTGILGIQSAGKAFVPLDPEWPAERINTIIAHSGISTIISSTETLAKVNAVISENLRLIDLNLLQNNEVINEQKAVLSHDLAYVMYTSGTTGKPKGVKVTHTACLIWLKWLQNTFHFHPEDRFICTSSIGFGGSLRQMYSTLFQGGTMHVIDRYDFKDPELLYQFLGRHKITCLNTVPSVMLRLAEWKAKNPNVQMELNSLRLVLVGGEMLHTSSWNEWKEQFTHNHRVYNLYGSTETVVNATYHELDKNKDYLEGIPIGKVRQGNTILLLREDGLLSSPGERGELLVGGASLAEGYLNDGLLTFQRFRNLKNEKGTFYATGDLAYQNKEGEYIYLGRNDDQIQWHGNRIEPCEIELEVLNHPQISRACMVLQENTNVKELVLFIQPESKKNNLDPLGIKNLLSQKLPSYMIPHRIQFVDQMPSNHAGKIDKKLLRLGITDQKDVKSSHFSSFSKTELMIAEIWKEILSLKKVKADDDFFFLGGDSIKAIDVLHRIRTRFSVAPTPITLFRKRTIASLAEELERLNPTKFESTPPKTTLAPDREIPVGLETSLGVHNSTNSSELKRGPLSSAQKGFIVLHKQFGNHPYSLLSIPLRDSFDIDKLKGCIALMIDRHEILRTDFIMNKGQYFQVVRKSKLLKIKEIILPSLDLKVFTDHVNFKAAYDVEVFMLHSETRESVLVFKLPHIVGDAWSLGIFLSELEVLCDDRELPALSSTYLEYALLENSNRSQNASTFWKDYFSGYKISPIMSSSTASDREFVVGKDRKDCLKELAGKNALSLNDLCFAIYVRSLLKIQESDEIIVSTSYHGRDYNLEGIEHLIGCFAKNVPVRLKRNSSIGLTDAKKWQSSFYEVLDHLQEGLINILSAFTNVTKAAAKDMYRFCFSYIKFAHINSSTSDLNFDRLQIHFNSGSFSPVLILAIREADDLTFNIHGTATQNQQELLEMHIQEEINALVNHDSNIDSALIAYFPTSETINKIIPGHMMNRINHRKMLSSIFSNSTPKLLEISEGSWGKSGVVFLPCFAEELLIIEKDVLLDWVQKAIDLASSRGARVVSLAGNLASRLNYGLDVVAGNTLAITTGHACTVVAMVLTIEKLLCNLEYHIKDLHLAIIGFGSIGQATIKLLMEKVGRPKEVTIYDRESKRALLNKKIVDLGVTCHFEGVSSSTVNVHDDVDLIIGASSSGDIIDLNELRPGSILVDDSFPSIVNGQAAISRMIQKQDVVIIGGGKLDLTVEKSAYLNFPEALAKVIVDKLGNAGMPGCRVESILCASNPNLKATTGLVILHQAESFYNYMVEKSIAPVPFHLENYQIQNSYLDHFKKTLLCD